MKAVTFNIVLLRHAQTEHSERNRLMGILDIPCSRQGRAQARALGKKLGNERYFRIYSSPLTRAIQTAQDVFPRGDVTVEECLIERNLGNWAGKTLEDVASEHPEAFLKSGHLDPFYTPKNGEPMEDMISRVKSFLAKLHDLHTAVALENVSKGNNRIAIVTHNGVIRVIRCLTEKLHFSDMYNQAEIYLNPIHYTYDGDCWKSTSFPQNGITV